jgi:tripartite-type tricarboxylate transporter receptor subunit TctC
VSKFRLAIMRMLSLGMLLHVAGYALAQQPYPNRPIRFIVPYPPGGTTTLIGQLFGQKLTESFGQQVLVDNRPGAGTMIGTDALAKSAPDGHTILLAGSSHTLVPQLLKAPYDPIKDFAPVVTIAKTELVLVLNAAVPAGSLREFIAYARSNPGQLNYATPGAGGMQHLASELLNLKTGIKTQHVPYKGAGQALIDLIAGEVQLYIITRPAFVPHSKNSKLRAIAITGEARSPILPEVPTFAEAGLPDFDMKAWFGILMPAGTPKSIIDKMGSELTKYLALSDFKDKLNSQGLEPFVSTSEQYAALLKEDMATYANIIKSANIKFEN